MDEFGVDIPHPASSIAVDFGNVGMKHECRQLIVAMRGLYHYNDSAV